MIKPYLMQGPKTRLSTDWRCPVLICQKWLLRWYRPAVKILKFYSALTHLTQNKSLNIVQSGIIFRFVVPNESIQYWEGEFNSHQATWIEGKSWQMCSVNARWNTCYKTVSQSPVHESLLAFHLDGSDCFCMDYPKGNSVTKPDCLDLVRIIALIKLAELLSF